MDIDMLTQVCRSRDWVWAEERGFPKFLSREDSLCGAWIGVKGAPSAAKATVDFPGLLTARLKAAPIQS
jgi:hypothetical protein